MIAAARIVDPTSLADASFGKANRKYGLAGRMAAAIVSITRDNGDCLPQDLNEKGFTPAEVSENWHMAKSLAAVELKLVGGAPVPSLGVLRRP